MVLTAFPPIFTEMGLSFNSIPTRFPTGASFFPTALRPEPTHQRARHLISTFACVHPRQALTFSAEISSSFINPSGSVRPIQCCVLVVAWRAAHTL